MTELQERFQGLGNDLDRANASDLWDEARHREPRSSTEVAGYPRTRKALVITTAFALTIATTGIVIRAFHEPTHSRAVLGSTTQVTWPPVIHSSHPPVSRAFSRACPIKGGNFKMRPEHATPRSTVTASGPVYYRDEAGRFVWYVNEHPGADYQAWWGLDPKHYASVATKALSIAKGRPYELSGSGPQMLGDDVPNGACSFSLRFTVPDVAAGTYPVSIVTISGRGSTTYAWFAIDVKNPSSPRSALLHGSTRSGVLDFSASGVVGTIWVHHNPASICYSTGGSVARPIVIQAATQAVTHAELSLHPSGPRACTHSPPTGLAADMVAHPWGYQIVWRPRPGMPTAFSSLTKST